MAIEALKNNDTDSKNNYSRNCVDREKATEILEYYYDKDSDGYKQAFKMIVEDLESVTPTHGKMLVCPNCGLDVHSDFENCPRCGERMKNE